MNLRKRLRNHAEVHTSALNDILFILLFFFLIVSTLANPNVIKVTNPKAKSDTKAKQAAVVSVDKEGQVYLGQQHVDVATLEPQLKAFLAKESTITNPSVVINGDTTAHFGLIIEISQVIKRAGATPVFAVKKSE